MNKLGPKLDGLIYRGMGPDPPTETGAGFENKGTQVCRPHITRRQFFGRSALGLGTAALAYLLNQEARAGTPPSPRDAGRPDKLLLLPSDGFPSHCTVERKSRDRHARTKKARSGSGRVSRIDVGPGRSSGEHPPDLHWCRAALLRLRQSGVRPAQSKLHGARAQHGWCRPGRALGGRRHFISARNPGACFCSGWAWSERLCSASCAR